MTDAKRWFELRCRHCGQRFVEMTRLVFHRCPAQGDAHRSPQAHERDAGQPDPATEPSAFPLAGKGAR